MTNPSPHDPWHALHSKWKSSQLTATVFLYVEFPVCLDLRSVIFQRNFESFVFHFLPGLHWTGCTIWTDGLIKVQTQLQKHSKITNRETVKNTYSKNYNLQCLLPQAPHYESEAQMGEKEKNLLLCKQRKHTSYLSFFFTQSNFLENEIYTEKRQFFTLNL